MIDSRAFLQFWLTKHDYRIGPTGRVGNHMYADKLSSLASILFLDYRNYKQTHPNGRTLPNITKEEFRDALREAIDLRKSEAVKEVYETVRFNGTEYLEPLNRYVEAVFGKLDITYRNVLAHHISNIKRKMAGLPVQWHIMPILSGPQGTGKTVAVKQLYSPLGPLMADMSLTTALNSFTQGFVERQFLVLFDEMAGLDKADFNGLKRMITSDGGTYRKAHEPDESDFKNNCSFVGTTNDPASLLLKDTTGARRFFELEVSKPTDHETLGLLPIKPGAIDYAELWRGINELDINRYFNASREEIEIAQAKLRAPEPVEEFLNFYGLRPSSEGEYTYVLHPTLFKLFADWVKQNNFYFSYNNITFGRKLKALGIEKTSKVVSGKNYTGIKVNATHGLPLGELESEQKVIQKLRSSLKVLENE